MNRELDRKDSVVVRLHLSWARYGTASAICGALGAAMGYLSTQPTLAKPTMTAKGQAIGRLLMSVDPIAGVWPLAAGAAAAFLALSLFMVWALSSKRPFELRMDEDGVTWPSLAPWRAPFGLSWSDIRSVACNPAGDHLVFATSNGRRVLPAWWLPPGTSPNDVVRDATALREHARRAGSDHRRSSLV
jgi:hypothetical protein